MTVVILTAGIDLAVGSVLALCAVSIAKLLLAFGWHPLSAVVAVLASVYAT